LRTIEGVEGMTNPLALFAISKDEAANGARGGPSHAEAGLPVVVVESGVPLRLPWYRVDTRGPISQSFAAAP
jgi:hypothetical protein